MDVVDDDGHRCRFGEVGGQPVQTMEDGERRVDGGRRRDRGQQHSPRRDGWTAQQLLPPDGVGLRQSSFEQW